MSTQDEAKPTPVPINFNKSRPRFQVTIRRLACLAYAFTIFLLILIGLILAFPISVFLEPSPYKSIYFKGDASKEPHRVIKPLFDKATKFNVHSTLWKDWTGVPSSRKIEEMGGPKARPGEDVEEIGFVCGGDKEGCWLKQYSNEKGSTTDNVFRNVSMDGGVRSYSRWQMSENTPLVYHPFISDQSMRASFILDPLPHSIPAFEDSSLEFVSAESIYPETMGRLFNSNKGDSQELWCPYRHGLGKGDCNITSNSNSEPESYNLRERMGLVSHSLPMLELFEETDFDLAGLKPVGKEGTRYQPYVQSVSHLVLSKENAWMDKDLWMEVFKEVQSNLTQCLREENIEVESRDAADCVRDQVDGPFSTLLTFRLKEADPSDEKNFRYFYTPFLTSSPTASSPKDLRALPTHTDFRNDESLREAFPKSTTLGFPKENDLLFDFNWQITLSQASSARARWIREVDFGFLVEVVGDWNKGSDIDPVERAQLDWLMHTVLFLTGNWILKAFDLGPVKEVVVTILQAGSDVAILFLTLLYWATRSTLSGISSWSTSLYVISQIAFLFNSFLELRQDSTLLWILYKPKPRCPNPLIYPRLTLLSTAAIVFIVALVARRMIPWLSGKLDHDERRDSRLEVGDAKWAKGIRILSLLFLFGLSAYLDPAYLILYKRRLVFTRFDGVRASLPTLDPMSYLLTRNLWITTFLGSEVLQLLFNSKRGSLAGKFRLTIIFQAIRFAAFRHYNLHVDIASQPYTLLNLIYVLLLASWSLQAIVYSGVSQVAKQEVVHEEEGGDAGKKS